MMRMGPTGPRKPLKPDTLKRVMAAFLPYKGEMAWIIFLVLVSAGLGVAPPYLLRKIIDEGLQKGNLDIVAHFSLYTLLTTIGSVGLSLAFGYYSVVVGQRIMRDFRERLFAHLQGMPLKFFTSTRTGEIQSRLTNDVTNVQSVLSDTVAGVVSNITIVISTLVGMFIFDWRLTLLGIGMLPLFALVAARVGAKAGEIRKKSAEHNANISATMQETLSVSGVLLTKTSGRQANALSRFRTENEALTTTSVQMNMIMRYFFSMIRLTFSVTPIAVYWMAGYLIVHEKDTHLTVGTIVGFTALQSALLFPLTQLLSVQADVTSSLSLFDRIFEYLDLKQEIVDAPNPIHLKPSEVKGAVAFENVSFKYEESQEEPTLADITFDAKPGQLIALVGSSGAGKTTLTYLIPRLYDANTGRVTIDGHDVKQIALVSLGECIGVVTQETYLVHDTIRENLRYGRPDATDPELEAAAKAAAIYDHIAGLPEGFDTVVGERGYKLSGGEKQRIAIARAILKNPRILILDEATSALDTRSERLIQDALARLSEGRTTFAIAHRLSTILAADQILVMDHGRIVERGTHTELLERGEAYSRLYHAQFETAPDTTDANIEDEESSEEAIVNGNKTPVAGLY